MGFRDRKNPDHRANAKGEPTNPQPKVPAPRFMAVCGDISSGVKDIDGQPMLSLVGALFPAGQAEFLFPIDGAGQVAQMIAQTAQAFEASQSKLHVVGGGVDLSAEAEAQAKLRGEDPPDG